MNKTYQIWDRDTDIKGTKLVKGQQLRVDLYNTDIKELEELKGISYKEFTEGHTEGEYTRIYIEILGDLSKKELIETIRTKAIEIMNKFDTIEKKESFTQYLIKKRNNENCKWTLQFVNYCATCKDWEIKARGKQMLIDDSRSIGKTYFDMVEFL